MTRVAVQQVDFPPGQGHCDVVAPAPALLRFAAVALAQTEILVAGQPQHREVLQLFLETHAGAPEVERRFVMVPQGKSIEPRDGDAEWRCTVISPTNGVVHVFEIVPEGAS